MKSFYILMLTSLSAILAHADLSPTNHDFFNLMPIEATGVSLDTALVDINWPRDLNDPCEAKAVFRFTNKTETPQRLHVGFPILLDSEYSKDILDKYDYKISFNGHKTEKIGITKYEDFDESLEFEWEWGSRKIPVGNREVEWFGKELEFPVGKSECVVTYKIPLSYSSNPYRRRVHYFLHTGRGWNGKIKKEVVTIHFPWSIDKRQIEKYSTTKGYTIGEDSISWEYINFEPTKEHNIFIEMLEYRAFSDLQTLEGICKHDPDNRMAKLALVKHYFALGRHKGLWTRVPNYVNKKEMDDIIGSINDPSEQKFIKGLFTLVGSEKYKCTEDNEKRQAFSDLLFEIDYVPPFASSAYVDKARDIIEKHLKDNPADEYAWLIYLSNIYRFTPCRNEHKTEKKRYEKLLEEALNQCPKTQSFQWLSIGTPEKDEILGFKNYESLIGITTGVFPSTR